MQFRYRRLVGWLGLALVISGCGPLAAPPAATTVASTALDTVAAEFAADWQAGRTSDASALATDSGAAAQLMEAVAGDLRATSLSIGVRPASVDGTRGSTEATLTWSIPEIGDWTYETTWTWEQRTVEGTARWRIDFEPQSIHPELGRGQTLSVRTEPGIDGPIVDRDDVVLIAPVRVYSVVLLVDHITDLESTAGALATILAPRDPSVTAEDIINGVRAARQVGRTSYTVTNLREDDFAPVEQRLTAIAAVSLPSQVRDLPPSPGFAATLLGTALPIARQMTTGKPGWRIVTVDMAGDELQTVAEHPAVAGAKVTLTIDPAIQDAAQAAVDPISQQAVIVAIQPSTGEILAVAQNAAATTEGPIALMGRYPPGSTFKIVTASAAIDAGLITPTTSVACPGSWTADLKTIRNDGFALGTVTATTAFAHSCNTTFAALAAEMSDSALPEAASQYGIGLDFDITGITTLTGAIQNGTTVLARAQNGFGQGTDLVTPFAAALMAATAATGSMPVPTLIRGTRTTVDRPAPARSEAVQQAIRTMMRAVVTEGTAKRLGGLGEVYAKTGTAEYVTQAGTIEAHAWTVGFRGDVAFAALIVGGNSSQRTNDLVKSFLAAVPEP